MAFVRNEKDCVSTNANGADSSRLYIPTTLGVGYSLIPRIAPTYVAVGERYSMASVPNNRRVLANARLSGPLGSGERCHSPLISNPRYSSSDEHQTRPDLYVPKRSGSYLAKDALSVRASVSQASRASAKSSRGRARCALARTFDAKLVVTPDVGLCTTAR